MTVKPILMYYIFNYPEDTNGHGVEYFSPGLARQMSVTVQPTDCL